LQEYRANREGRDNIKNCGFHPKRKSSAEKNDLDNFLKPIIDALNEIKIFDESMISSITIDRIKVDTSSEQGIDIEFL
jgi:Holliday junction resolvase RusA-like endonuclease